MKHLPHVLLHSVFYASLFLTAFLFISGIYFFVKNNTIQNRIYPHVYIDNTDFGYKTKEDVLRYFENRNKNLQNMHILISYKTDSATMSGELLKVHYDSQTLAKQAYLVGRSPRILSAYFQKIKTLFNLGRFSFPATIGYDTKPAEDFLNMLEDKYNVPPENALFQYENGRVTVFKIEKNGIKIQTSQTLTLIDQQIVLHAKEQTLKPVAITLPVTVQDSIIYPQITLSSLNNFGIQELIGIGKSDYSGSIPGRIANVKLAATKFNGVIVPKDSEFSFNTIIGDISAATGYQQAYVIKNGRTVLGDGGGVCQVSTTLFRAAMNTGLPITERHAHAYQVHYYMNDAKAGFDATTFNPGVDFKFKNDTGAAILIQETIDDQKNLLTIYFYGKKDARKIELSDATISNSIPAPSPLYQDDPTLKKGVTKQTDWAAAGVKSVFHYKVTKAHGMVSQDRDFVSVYQPWQAVYLVGTAD